MLVGSVVISVICVVVNSRVELGCPVVVVVWLVLSDGTDLLGRFASVIGGEMALLITKIINHFSCQKYEIF